MTLLTLSLSYLLFSANTSYLVVFPTYFFSENLSLTMGTGEPARHHDLVLWQTFIFEDIFFHVVFKRSFSNISYCKFCVADQFRIGKGEEFINKVRTANLLMCQPCFCPAVVD